MPLLLGYVPHALAIYAFGSRIHGEARADSDWDIALLMPGYADPLLLWQVSGNLADALGGPVDLLDLRAASTVMQAQVLEKGIKLWSVEPQAGLFECFAASQMLELNAARAGILDDIAKRGTVYGR